MDNEAMVRRAYDRLDRWDTSALLEDFGPEAKFFVPGRTQVSGDHPREDIPRVLDVMRELSSEGFKSDLLAIVPSEHGAMAILHQYVTRNGVEHGYHCVQDWDIRDGKVAYWWIYVHEYDEFEKAWA